MKKLLTFLLAAIAFVACTQNDVDELSANRVDVPETLTVGFEGGDTRIELNEALKTVWTEGDEVSVFYYSDANNKFAYQGETGERFGELKLVGRGDSVADVPGVVTVYPYNPNYKINALTANLLLNLPSKQYYKSDSYGENGNIMVAYSEFNQFMLRSIYGWLRIDITGEGQKVRTIRVKGNRGEQMAGAVHVDSSDATMTLANEQSDIEEDDELGGVGGNIVVDGAAKDEVILDCKGEVELSSEATSFYVALPPQALAEGFTVAIYCTNGTMMTKDYTNSVEIKRNHIHPVSAFKYNGMEGEEPETDITLPEDSDPSNTTFHHRVLLIDHVGVNCGNCPRVMSGMKALEETDWRNYYNVAEVHGGAFAPAGRDNAYSYAATVVDKFYGVSGYPNIRFNFYDGEGSISNVTQFVSQNSAILESLVNKDGADAGIAAAAVGNDSAVAVSIGVKAAVTQEYKVTAWLLENGIYNPNQAAATEEYHKNRDHVLRYIAGEYSSNDLSGDSLGIIGKGLTAYCNYTIPIEDEWEYSNLNLLIIVSAEDENGDFDVVNTALCPINTWVDYYDNRGEVVGNKSFLAAPNVAVVDVTETGFTIRWDAVENAEYYEVVVEDMTYETYETSLTFENLERGGCYHISVKAVAPAGSDWYDSQTNIQTYITGPTSADWFEQKLYTDTYVNESTGEAYYPYNSLFVDYKGEGVASLSVSFFPTEQLQTTTEADILANLSIWDEICADVNSAEGASFHFEGLEGGVSYTLCTLAINTEGKSCFMMSECSTEAAEISEAAKAWLGSWNVTSHEIITFDDMGNITFSEAEDTFTINITANTSAPNELVIDGFSLLGEGWPVRGMVDEEGNLNIMNGDIVGVSEEGDYYIWLAYFLLDGYDAGQFLSDAIPTYVFKMDDAGAVTCEMFTTEAEFQDGTKVNIVAAHTEIYDLDPNSGNMYFLIESFPAVFRANEFDMTKAAAPAAKRMSHSRYTLPATKSQYTIDKSIVICE